jgi:serine-type D-Ala-D-Ala carboxypeptidase (penicillin-binding protein 5/6)
MRNEMVHALAHERAHRVVPRSLWTLLAVVVVVYVAVQLLRPVPGPVFRSALSSSLRLAGTAPSLPWPTSGSAAMALEGGAVLGSSGGSGAVPIASIAKVLTAYTVLKDHPIAPGNNGPSIAVTSDVVTAYQQGAAGQQSEVPVAAGETLTELQALEGLLVVGANDMATLLADWDAGSVSAFLSKMTSEAGSLGLRSTHVTDPSGLDPATVSSPSDLLKLGQAAMAVPTLAQIVDMAQVTLPMGGTVYNTDADLGIDGIVGVKTGNDTAAGGCFLFAAQDTVSGQSLTLVGVVLGQDTTTPTAAALSSAKSLVSSAIASASPIPLLGTGQVVGYVKSSWGQSVPVVASTTPTVVGWPGLSVPVVVKVPTLPGAISKGQRLGTLDVDVAGRHVEAVVQAAAGLSGPSILWRLTHF